MTSAREFLPLAERAGKTGCFSPAPTRARRKSPSGCNLHSRSLPFPAALRLGASSLCSLLPCGAPEPAGKSWQGLKGLGSCRKIDLQERDEGITCVVLLS